MRIGLILLPLALCAAPVAAQPVQLPPELSDPATADKLTRSMQSLSKVLLELKVGGLQAAIEGREPTAAERDLTVGDLTGKNSMEIERQIAAARPKIEQSIRALDQALPQLTADLQRAQRSLKRAIANMPDPNYPKR